MLLRLRRFIRLEQQHKGKDEKQVGHKWEQRLLFRLLWVAVVVSEFWVTVFVVVVVVVGSLAVVDF